MNRFVLFFSLVIGFFFTSSYARVFGNVIDSTGMPISNVLVSLASDNYVYTKTDVNGDFSLDINDGSIRLAALNYQTIDSIAVPPETFTQIEMIKDTLLNTDVFRISFDHIRPGASYSKEELKQDFPVGYGLGFYEGSDSSTDRAYVDDTEDFSGNGRSLRVFYPAGQVKTANSGVDTRIPLSGTFKNNTFASDELFLSYWVKFSSNFDMDACGGKLPSLGGSLAYLREAEWKGRIMWGVGGSIRFYMELPHDADGMDSDSIRFLGEKEYDGGSLCLNKFTPYLDNKQWHQIELHYKLEANGEPGLFEVWIDGDKGHKVIDSKEFGYYRRAGAGLDDLTINAILLSTFLGGGAGWEQDQDVYAWFDEFRVSTTRIGGEYELPPPNVPIDPTPTKDSKVVTKSSNLLIGGNFVEIPFREIDYLSLYDLSGNLLVKSNHKDAIGESKLKVGIYFLLVKSGVNSFTSKIIIKD